MHWVIKRVSLIEAIKNNIVVATTQHHSDDFICGYADKIGMSYRGSGQDVLSRVLEAADSIKLDTIIHITGDCPI